MPMVPGPAGPAGMSRLAALRVAFLALLASAGSGGWAADGVAGPPEAPPKPLQMQSDPDEPEGGRSPTSPSPPDPQMVEKGRRTYRDFCQKCHGLNMVSAGGGFFDLRTFPRDQKPRFVNSVTNGKRAMPAWGSVLKAEEIESLWAYVSSGSSAR